MDTPVSPVVPARVWINSQNPGAEPWRFGLPAFEHRKSPIQSASRSPSREGATSMSKVLVSGSAGFIGGYVVEELLRRGHDVLGIDNLSKYGRVSKSYDSNDSYQFVEGDCRDVDLLTKLAGESDHFIAGAAMIG